MSNLKKFFAKELAEELEVQRAALTVEFNREIAERVAEVEKLTRGKHCRCVSYDPNVRTYEMRVVITEDLLYGTHDPEKAIEMACRDLYMQACNQLLPKVRPIKL
jgi:hypothetical protein